jgi:ElaB/YqjD/DUF883 family membrane-anchored ribosome-binding protein
MDTTATNRSSVNRSSTSSEASGGASSVVDKIDDALRVLNEAAPQKQEEIRRMIKKNYRNVKSMMKEWEEEAKDSLENLGDRVSQFQHDVVDQAKKTSKKVDRQVHEHPWSYIGGAALVGLAAGVLIGWRR